MACIPGKPAASHLQQNKVIEFEDVRIRLNIRWDGIGILLSIPKLTICSVTFHHPSSAQLSLLMLYIYVTENDLLLSLYELQMYRKLTYTASYMHILTSKSPL